MKPIFSSSISIVSADKASPGSIKEGAQVFVRVLGREGAGRYTVSFAGQRFSVASQRVFEIGSSFKALVRIERGQVLLIPQTGESLFTKKAAGITRFSSFASDKTGSLSSLLHELGLPADNFSFLLVSFLQESGIRFNRTAALKARSLAKRFPGREEAAAEASLLLTEKGMEPDEASVSEILALLYGEYTGEKSTDTDSGSGDFDNAARNGKNTPSVIESLYTDAERCLSLPSGLLTFLNHYKTGDKHWVFLPYDYNFRDFRFNGVIRFLFNLEQQKTEKIIISAFSAIKDYFFVVYYDRLPVCSSKRTADVDFCINPSPSVSGIKKLERFLHEVMPENIGVRYKPDLFDTGGCVCQSFFSRVEEKA